MDEIDTKVECLKISAERNQKLQATPKTVVEEAQLYFDFVFTKPKPGVKRKSG